MVVAHPDDEDGGMLTYESRGQGVDTTLLTLNRGEGGQNVMTSDYWDQLGTMRTQELLAAGNYYGVHQYWTRVADFGFSKTIDEALKTWGKDRVLYDAVRVIRITRPLVVSSVFVGNVSDGHGHHQVAGYMAQEVYKAAGDPKIFPDQIKPPSLDAPQGLRPHPLRARHREGNLRLRHRPLGARPLPQLRRRNLDRRRPLHHS
jgi:LmbE family N-acetylglucosaminyl deacetylase